MDDHDYSTHTTTKQKLKYPRRLCADYACKSCFTEPPERGRTVAPAGVAATLALAPRSQVSFHIEVPTWLNDHRGHT